MQEPLIQNQHIFNNQNLPHAAAPPEQPIGFSSDNLSNNVGAEQVMNWAKMKKSKIQWGPLIATIVFVLGIINMIILHLTVRYWDFGLTIVLFFCGYYPVYLVIACSCDKQARQIDKIDPSGNIQEEYKYYRQLDSRFRFTALCFHYETRYITRTDYDSKGNKRTWTQSRQQMRETHRAEQPLFPTKTTDVSGDLGCILSNTALVFINYCKRYKFDNEHSKHRFQAIFERFKTDHKRDAQQRYYIDFMVPGMEEEGVYFVGPQKPNLKKWYCFFVMIGMSWPYSLWMESKITRFDVLITKMITI